MNGDPITGVEAWNDLSSPEPELSLIESDTQVRSRSANDLNMESSITSEFPVLSTHEQNGGPQLSKSSQSSSKTWAKWQECILKTLVFIGYAITTILFYIIIYLHYFVVKLSYDEETAMNLLDGVFRAQEKAIDNFHKKRSTGPHAAVVGDDNHPPHYR
ncbi:uncharacterized protein LODBEIA_P27960 [Lodderomyces beijingensis]|uniref:Uncharacterized protein n=1 Tax=Lodderomyces beijingensis TaxID=1775926 RepID=A0ABP0ZMJ0_9ASCO